MRIKWEVYFSKELCPLVFIVLTMFPRVYMYSCMCIMWLYNTSRKAPLLIYVTENTHWINDGLKTYSAQKMTVTPCLENATTSTCSGKHYLPQNCREPLSFELKGILVSFLSSVILLQLSADKEDKLMG